MSDAYLMLRWSYTGTELVDNGYSHEDYHRSGGVSECATLC